MPRPRRVDQVAAGPLPDAEICDDRVVHVAAVRAARAALPAPPLLAGAANLFAALGDPTRLRLVAALAGGELCVCDLAAAVGLSESAVSHQLRVLRSLDLVRSRREGKRVYYVLHDDHVTTLFGQAIDHVEHRPADAPADGHAARLEGVGS